MKEVDDPCDGRYRWLGPASGGNAPMVLTIKPDGGRIRAFGASCGVLKLSQNPDVAPRRLFFLPAEGVWWRTTRNCHCTPDPSPYRAQNDVVLETDDIQPRVCHLCRRFDCALRLCAERGSRGRPAPHAPTTSRRFLAHLESVFKKTDRLPQGLQFRRVSESLEWHHASIENRGCCLYLD